MTNNYINCLVVSEATMIHNNNAILQERARMEDILMWEIQQARNSEIKAALIRALLKVHPESKVRLPEAQ